MGPTHPKASLRQNRAPYRKRHPLVGEVVSRSFEIPGPSHPHPICSLDSRRHGGRCLGGWSDSDLSSRCAIEVDSADGGQQLTGDSLRNIPFTPFYRFSPTLKSLYVSLAFLPCPQILDLVRSSSFSRTWPYSATIHRLTMTMSPAAYRPSVLRPHRRLLRESS